MITNSIERKKAAELLMEWDNILILCHKNPDGDTIGSACGLLHALKKLSKKCAIICNDKFPDRYDFTQAEIYKNQFIPEHIVSVDVATLALFGEKTLPYSENVELSIDHHPSNSGYAQMVCCEMEMPATAQLVFEIIKLMGVKIDTLISNCLYTAIITDTGCFKYSSTKASTHIAAAELIENGAEHSMLAEKFFMSKSRKNIELEKFALNTLEFLYNDRCALIALPGDVLEKIKPEPVDLDGISSLPRSIEGIDVGITIRQLNEGRIKISVRTSERADACQIAQGLGGGGHVRAAACEVVGTLQSAKNAIIKEVEKALCR